MNEARLRKGPRVSVVMATYNWAPVLPYSIGSVLDQTFSDFEMFVVGDGCTDESEAVVGSIGDARVQWVNLPVNCGHQSGPNNEGIRMSTGEIVAFIGHDDIWLPNHLDALVPAIDEGHGVAHSRWLAVHPERGPQVVPPEGWEYRRGHWVPPTATVYSRSILARAGDWKPPAETGQMDPEAHLMSRASRIAGPPVLVDQITCIKFAASARKDVYRIRPHHEQAHWLDAIRRGEDPVAAVLRESAKDGRRTKMNHPVFSNIRWFTQRAMRRLGRLLGVRPQSEDALARYLRTRRYKGL